MRKDTESSVESSDPRKATESCKRVCLCVCPSALFSLLSIS